MFKYTFQKLPHKITGAVHFVTKAMATRQGRFAQLTEEKKVNTKFRLFFTSN